MSHEAVRIFVRIFFSRVSQVSPRISRVMNIPFTLLRIKKKQPKIIIIITIIIKRNNSDKNRNNVDRLVARGEKRARKNKKKRTSPYLNFYCKLRTFHATFGPGKQLRRHIYIYEVCYAVGSAHVRDLIKKVVRRESRLLNIYTRIIITIMRNEGGGPISRHIN